VTGSAVKGGEEEIDKGNVRRTCWFLCGRARDKGNERQSEDGEADLKPTFETL